MESLFNKRIGLIVAVLTVVGISLCFAAKEKRQSTRTATPTRKTTPTKASTPNRRTATPIKATTPSRRTATPIKATTPSRRTSTPTKVTAPRGSSKGKEQIATRRGTATTPTPLKQTARDRKAATAPATSARQARTPKQTRTPRAATPTRTERRKTSLQAQADEGDEAPAPKKSAFGGFLSSFGSFAKQAAGSELGQSLIQTGTSMAVGKVQGAIAEKGGALPPELQGLTTGLTQAAGASVQGAVTRATAAPGAEALPEGEAAPGSEAAPEDGAVPGTEAPAPARSGFSGALSGFASSGLGQTLIQTGTSVAVSTAKKTIADKAGGVLPPELQQLADGATKMAEDKVQSTVDAVTQAPPAESEEAAPAEEPEADVAPAAPQEEAAPAEESEEDAAPAEEPEEDAAPAEEPEADAPAEDAAPEDE